MVSAAAKLLRPALLLLLLAATAPAKEPADYQTGQTAEETITTPVALTVVDRDATELLRWQEITRIPVIFRFNPAAATEAGAAFHTAFAAARENFLAALEKKFSARKLDAAALTNAPFQEFIAAFSPGAFFPAGKNLLTLWAAGEPDDAVQTALAVKLRDAASLYLRPENLPADLKPGARVQVFALTNAAAPTLETVRRSAVEVSRLKLVTLTRARGDLREACADEPAVAKFLAGLLRENCAPDADLTRQSRARQTAAILSADHYEAGQVLVSRGQIVTAKARAALEELARQLAATQPAGPPLPWLGIALALAAPASGFIFWQLARRKNTSSLPVKFAGGAGHGVVIACPTCAGHIVVPLGAADCDLPDCGHDHTPEHWRKRALAAESRAEQATAIVRAGLLPQLARFLTHDLVKKMVSQRTEMLAAQNQAADQVEDLAGRLEHLETVPQGWREFYEKRIAELEKELETKSEENRTLIRTQIAIARRQMADAQDKPGWN